MGIPAAALRQAYLDACEAELQAFKPGNVSVHSEGHGMVVADFRDSARASAAFLCDPALSLGEKIFHAVRATQEAVGCNTNLGIILLAAPLLHACQPGRPGIGLRGRLRQVLDGTTVADAEWAYQAIRLAAPGGLGESAEQDVHSRPVVTLQEAMRLAAGRDRIAWQFTNSYGNVFDLAIPRYHSGMSLWDNEAWATVAVFAGLLKAVPDSHIERKFGARFTRMVADSMMRVDHALSASDRPEDCLPLLREVDAEMKSAGLNPGTTADLTVACLLAVRLEKLLEG
ncbi:MAG: triphosphoribosyl-dephospho-CoA synthase [Candidatus Methylumidiphilus sp.]